MSARSLNKVQLIGNLTRDPEVRYTGSGTAVATLGVATNRSWKDQNGEQQESAQFHNIVAWNKLAEICQQLLAKGMKIYVEGELQTRSWEGDDGVTRYKTEVRINDMILLDSKGREGVGMPADGGSSSSAPANDAGSDDSAVKADDKKKAKAEEPAPVDDSDPLEDLPF